MVDMYDKYGLKAEFLSSALKNANTIQILFNNCKEIEANLEKDICEFDIENFQLLIKYLLKSNNGKTVGTYISHINNYLDYNCNFSKSTLNKELIKQNIPNMAKWIRENTEEPDYSNNFINMEELIRLEDCGEFSSQELAVYWLAFIGFNKKEIINFKSKDVSQWKNKLGGEIIISESIENTIYKVLLSAIKENGFIKRNSKGNGTNYSLYKNMKYLIRSDKGKEDDPISSSTLYTKFSKLEKYLKKSNLDEVNLRKSGMLYFGSEIIRNTELKTIEDLHKLVLEPICKAYAEKNNTYIRTLNSIFTNVALKKFYNIELPEKLKRKDKSILLIKEHIKFKKPKAREESDKKPWREQELKGKYGEEIAFAYIKNNFIDSYFVKDCYGYDVFAENENDYRLIEIKTMENRRCYINITKHEYIVAEKNNGWYWFYILVWESKGNKRFPQLYIYKDFLDVIGLRNKQDKLFKEKNSIGNKNIECSYMDFRLQLNDAIFGMSDYCICLDVDNANYVCP